MPYVGSPVRRREDRALLTGAGRFVDDIGLPRMLHLAVVRSTHAHARLGRIDTKEATALPGVAAVFTAADLPAPGPRIPPVPIVPGLDTVAHPLLADGIVRYVGEPIAAILASDRYTAEDAADRVRVAYDVLPAVVDPEGALAPEAPVLHAGRTSNLVFERTVSGGDPDAAFRSAAVVVEAVLEQPRLAAVPLECRGIVAAYDPRADRIEVWLSTQTPHGARDLIAEILEIPRDRVRVVAPDVGGGFGAKGSLYPEEVLAAYLVLRLRRPIKWVEDRIENLRVMTHGRGQRARVRAAAAQNGRILAVETDVLADLGAYCLSFTAGVPTLTPIVGLGAYRIEHVRYRVRGVATTTAPTGPYRGAGRPEAAYYIERIVDLVAARLGLDPVEVRRRNFIVAFPYASPTGLTYDSGNYPALLDRALALADYRHWREEQARRRRQGGHPVGIRISTWVEIAGGGELWESGAVRLEPSGQITVLTGSSPHGQGLATAFSQIAADALGVAPEDVAVVHGDTDAVPTGLGTYGSRSLSIGGSAVHLAAAQLRTGIIGVAARLLEAARAVSLAEVANAAPAGMDAALDFTMERMMVPSGAHVAVVEVDEETGEVDVLRYAAVDDCGRVVNPMLVEGQIHGSLAQGLAQALFERVVYAKDGQLLTGSLLDYAVPTAADFPEFSRDSLVSPSPLNPLGAKGIGESGTIGAPPALVNAVEDALRPRLAGRLDLPLLPDRIWQALRGGTR
ncbi:MAG: xanthine dehydrogenase family protein molybdopterin-binding subunit [Bacillati bacterium ANGP1]|uniref:Xanthine dehydrogenase family protein molybdopterin-binding subunit n=1 Tax=Candidatus Segetimicrobium genomatis TaxID=2569760 RepID=A0A537JFX9_9BACT|nr:MAG: xanthine dehydrogenase family protein molybdopterin-binding subunit [Terrabacteria group bacterium ANGP1]